MVIYNHLEFTVEVQRTLEGDSRIVGFDVEAFSIDGGIKDRKKNIKNKYNLPMQYLEEGKPVTFTYSLTTKVNSRLTWYTRFDHYLKGGNEEIHLMQLIISFCVVLAFGLVVGLILQRSLNRDFTNIK
jgi:hypothetical protein